MALSWRWGRTAALLFILPALLQVLQPSPGPDVEPSHLESRCPELVMTLMELNAPGAASEAIKELRNARPAAEGEPPLCALEYGEAAQRQARAVALVQWVQRLQTNIAKNPDDFKPPQPEPLDCTGKPVVPEVITKEVADEAVEGAVQAALICDAHNAEAGKLLETVQAQDESAAQASKKAWIDFKERSLDPWVPVLLGFLVWAAVVLVVARLLLAGLGRFMAPLTPGTDFMKWLFLGVATVALVVSSASSVGLLSILPVDFTLLLWEVLFWMLVGVAALLLVVRRVFVASWTEFLVRRWLFARIAKFISSFLLILGVVITTLQIATLVVGWASTPNLWLGAGAGGVAAILFAVGWGVDRRLTITATGDDAPTAEYMRSLIKQLAPDVPRGVEVPRGTDADVLKDVGIVTGSSTPLVAALARLFSLILPPTPWRLHVTAPTKDVLTAELTRNHRRIDSVVIDRATSFSFLGATDSTTDVEGTHGVPNGALDLAPFPAALAVVGIANAHRITQGLAGATIWRSVALQYLAAQQPRGSKAAKALFAHAVAADEKNMLALIGYWHSLYREADEEKSLRRYRDLLDKALGPKSDIPVDLDPKSDIPVDSEPALRMRVLYTRVAVGINLRSVVYGPEPVEGPVRLRILARALVRGVLVPDPDPDLPKLANQLTELVHDKEPGDSHEFKSMMRTNAQALLCSVPENTAVEWKPTVPARAEVPEAYGPGINYSLACYYAGRGNNGCAVQHLELADANPTLKAWRENDPQLATLRKAPEYCSRFGKTPPTDPLVVAPFSQYASQLRLAGLVTLDQIANASPRWLMKTGLTLATATRLRALARLGTQIRQQEQLDGWELAILTEMTALGWAKRPYKPKEREKLRESLVEAFKGYQKAPRPDCLGTWLSS